MTHSRIQTSRSSSQSRSIIADHPVATGIFASLAALAAAALINNRAAAKAEADNRPTGRFVDVDGLRLHYVERGAGDVVVLLHGSGSMVQDFETSGVLDLAARKYRVIAFDRPGFGHSKRPAGVTWSPEAQAELIHRALRQLGVTRALVLGHSWGASIAVAMALHHPHFVSALVLASGYYYPSVRLDVLALSGPAMPLVGNLIAQTLAPLSGRLAWDRLIRKMFSPAPVPRKFEGFPKEMAIRPSQLQASAEETGMMIPDAFAYQDHYAALKMPVVIIAGEGDKIIGSQDQSVRLHRELPQSRLHLIAGVGHMVHQSAPERVREAIDEAMAMVPQAPASSMALARPAAVSA